MNDELRDRLRALWAEVTTAHPDWPDPKVAAEVRERLSPADRAELDASAATVAAETAWFLRREGGTGPTA